jgi:integrase
MPDMAKHRGGGVSKHGARFRARARVSGKTISLGLYDTKADAQRAVELHLGELGDDALVPGGRTLGEWGLEWLRRRETGGLIRGIDRERIVWRTHLAPAKIATLPLPIITRVHVVQWLDRLVHDARALQPKRGKKAEPTERPLSSQTIRHALRVLRSCLRAAVDGGRIATNVAADVRVPRVQRPPKHAEPWAWLTLGEITALLATTHALRGVRGIRSANGKTHRVEVPERDRLAWTVAIYTGLRPPHELAGLRWRDVRGLDAAEPYLVVAATKTGTTREVPLLPPAREALRRLRELDPGVGAAYVFRPPTSKTGARRSHFGKSWDLGWRRWGAPQIARHVRLYDLRHTCASHLIQGSWGRTLTLSEVALWLGHRDIDTTRRYAHLAPEGLRGVARAMSEAWEES